MRCPSSGSLARVAGLLVVAALPSLASPSAQAESAGTVAGSCPGQVAEQPFARWADPADYVLVPNGTLETGAAWDLRGGATRVRGNESYYVHAKSDMSSLALPAGSSATTARMCVGVEHPTLRLLARNQGSSLSSLLIEVLFTDASGKTSAAPIGTHVGGAAWQPTPPYLVAANLFTLLPQGTNKIAFRFTPRDAGEWSIDDVYVDPFRHG